MAIMDDISVLTYHKSFTWTNHMDDRDHVRITQQDYKKCFRKSLPQYQ